MPQEAWKARHTYSLWAFPQADYPKLLAAYFAFCKSYYKEHRYRGNVVSGASRLHQDRGSLFSASYSGPMFTLEPSSTGEQGWDDFLIDFNDFASAHGGMPTFNQNACLAAGARGEIFRRTRQAVPRAAPAHRPSESAAQQLLRVSFGLERAGSKTRNDLGFDRLEFGIADEFGLEHFARLAQAARGFGFRAGGLRRRLRRATWRRLICTPPDFARNSSSSRTRRFSRHT